ncbi:MULTISPECIES: polyamine aminopropyltransferase [Streptomyces]|uniref:polyamine aminopropyltransferase n=1 Tax=Streptomyces TaxID=1883 RepID=UPI001291323F|nr:MULTISPECIES: polyamine aminopropyltransferase [Streptomyces]MCX5036461.1 polyamine aminopropyltransferase [Streptomyces coelicoflavus]QFX82670.1 polyamine aminopropyltransferase [Streptomyces sp. SYP-A7193]
MIEPHAPAPPGSPPSWGDACGPNGPGSADSPGDTSDSGRSGGPGGPCDTGGPCGPEATARLPVRPAVGRFLVLAGVFVCAACGLVYELELVALASYLIGDSVTQASVVLSVMVFAMGLGSLAAKRLRGLAAAGFGALEAVLALVGGSSAMVLYAVFAWTGGWGGLWADGPRVLLVAFSLAIGVLIGAEVPLLMELIQRVRRQDPGGAVADLFAADYVGALVGGLAFPFVLLPFLGQLTGALLTGTVNAAVGAALVLGLFRRDLTRRARWLLLAANVVVLALLATATVLADDFERAARQAVYGQDVRVAVRTDVQEVVLTGDTDGRPLDLFLDGRLRVRGSDERRYHEALVHPAMNGPHARVLVLGGGDGLAVREVLRHPGVRRVDVVELDPQLARLARHDPGLSALNEHAYGDARVHAGAGDAFHRLRSTPSATYDVVISDLPDPAVTASTKLYSQEFYGLLRRVLAPGGRLVVHAGPVSAHPRAFWTVDATLRAAGLPTAAYRVGARDPDSGPAASEPGPTPGLDRSGAGPRAPRGWGFLLAARTSPVLRLDPAAPRPRTLTPDSLARDARDAARTRIPGLPPSTLVHPRY